ncbi:MAG: hypothetical protein RLZZ200_1748, partial [Pseudomonadota bacterium]
QISPESDADYAVQRLLSIQQEQIQNRVSAQLALNRLRELSGDTGLDIKALLRFMPEEHQLTEEGRLRAAIDYNPSARRLRAEMDAAKAETKQAKAQIWPQLNAQATHYSGGDFTGQKDRVGLVMRVQTSNGFSRVAAVRAAANRESAAEAAIEGGVRDVREQVTADLSENLVAASRVETGNRAVAAARTVTESYLRQFAAGRRTWPEVLNVVREGVNSRITEADAMASAVASSLRLKLRSGEWRPAEAAKAAAR